jgi:hypothetical protein
MELLQDYAHQKKYPALPDVSGMVDPTQTHVEIEEAFLSLSREVSSEWGD